MIEFIVRDIDNSSPLIEKALCIASASHAEQVDKGGIPYLEHPIAVAKRMDSINEIVVALLHDVCEDSKITIEDLEKAEFPHEITSAILALTKINGELYEDYLKRVKHNKLAIKVKIEDMKHNSDLSRLNVITEKDLERQEKYRRAIDYLSSFTCEICNKTFNSDQMGDKITRDGKMVCTACLAAYEISWDEYEDWCSGGKSD